MTFRAFHNNQKDLINYRINVTYMLMATDDDADDGDFDDNNDKHSLR